MITSLGARRRLGTLADLVLLTGLTVVLGLHTTAFSGFPKGYDAYGHVSKVHLILAAFPHVNWNDAWYTGVPMFEGSYPPLFHLVVALFAWLGRASIERTIVLVGAGSILVQVLSLYGTVRAIAGGRVAGLVAGVLFVGSPALWSQVVRSGFYPRTMALALSGLALFAAASHVRRPTRWRFAGAVLAAAASMATHVAVGIPAAILGAALLAAAPTTSGSGRARIRRAAGFLAATVGLVAFFYVPLVFGYTSQRTFVQADPLPLGRLLGPQRGAGGDWLSYVLVPLAVVLAAAVAAGARSDRGAPGRTWPVRASVVLAAGALAWLVYGEAGHLAFLRRHTVYGLDPTAILMFVAWLLAGVCGVLLSVMLRDRWLASRRLLAGAVGGGVLVAGVVGLLAAVPGFPTPLSYDTAGIRALQRIFPSRGATHQYRVAAFRDPLMSWVNAISLTPQVRGYQSQAILHLNWQTWVEQGLESPGTSPAVRRFLLDWNAVRWVYAGPGVRRLEPYLAEPSAYRHLATTRKGRQIYATFEDRRPFPIMAATVAPTALVIGDRTRYDVVFRSLAPSDTGSARLVPVWTGAYVDDLSTARLRWFDVVVLYGASSHDDRRAAGLLAGYVRGGGGLVVEPGEQPALLHALQRAGLRQSGNQGRGRVLWSSVDGPAAIDRTGSSSRSADLARQILSEARPAAPGPAVAEVAYRNPEAWTVAVRRGSGVLFRQNRTEDWTASVAGRPVQIYDAGPNMMFVPLGRSHPAELVTFRYRLAALELTGLAITLVSLSALVLFVVDAGRWTRRPRLS